MLQDLVKTVAPIAFFFLATVLAFGVSFMLERYKK